MRRRYSSTGGFVFIEALILTMIVSTAAMLVMSGFREAQRLNRTAAIRSAAVFLADGKIAEAQNDPDGFDRSSVETFENFMGGMTIVFEIEATRLGDQVTVTVTPKVNGAELEDCIVTVERVVVNRP